MASASRTRRRHTYEEYLAYERDSALKHEYIDGEIIAMAGGSPRHSALASLMSGVLEAARKPGYHAFQSDQRIRILATGRATYPDVSMACGKLEHDPADPSGHALTSPTLIVEVLSPSTEEDDRGDKWHSYQRIPSLREYVLVSEARPRVESFVRKPDGTWSYRVATEGTFELENGASIDLAKLYDDLPP